ncbi:MAG: helix-turn-helix domain-containing protein [Pseudomonadota bacterium]
MNSRFNEQSYYEILEVEPGAAQHEIHEAYRRAKETYSAESPALYSMFSKEEARELLALIEEAFSTLSHQARRAAYDQKLTREASSREANSQDLPDFDPQEDVMNLPIEPELAPALNVDTIPEGFAKTKFGVYEVDKEFEAEVANLESLDGQVLQRMRTYKKITLEQVSDVTRISKAYLGAVENNDFEALPAKVFVRGFVVQMARVLGMNDNHAAKAYMVYYNSQNRE